MRWAACAALAWTGVAGASPPGIEVELEEDGFELQFERAMAVAPDQVFGYLNLGDLLIWRARTEPGGRRLLGEAERWLRRGLRAGPGHRGMLANLGRLEAVRIEVAGGDPALAGGHGR